MTAPKTIEEIWRDNGEQFPFDVTKKNAPSDYYFHVVALSPRNIWVGWEKDGNTIVSTDHIRKIWLPYKAPEPKAKVVALVNKEGSIHWLIEGSDSYGYYLEKFWKPIPLKEILEGGE